MVNTCPHFNLNKDCYIIFRDVGPQPDKLSEDIDEADTTYLHFFIQPSERPSPTLYSLSSFKMENESGVLLLAEPAPSDTCYCAKLQRPSLAARPETHVQIGLYPRFHF